MVKRYTLILFCGLFASGCGSLKNSPKYQLSDGEYLVKQGNAHFQKASVYVEADTFKIFFANDASVPAVMDPLTDQYFLKRSFDVDVMTILFKYRPETAGLPRQLTTDFNGNVFVGFRIDRFRLRHFKTPVGLKQAYKHRAVSLGAFGGLGSTSVTPWTTKNLTSDEYNGLIVSRGLALMVGLNNLTVGIGMGWDALTDRDKQIWIYQNKPWYGLTLGLNLN